MTSKSHPPSSENSHHTFGSNTWTCGWSSPNSVFRNRNLRYHDLSSPNSFTQSNFCYCETSNVAANSSDFGDHNYQTDLARASGNYKFSIHIYRVIFRVRRTPTMVEWQARAINEFAELAPHLWYKYLNVLLEFSELRFSLLQFKLPWLEFSELIHSIQFLKTLHEQAETTSSTSISKGYCQSSENSNHGRKINKRHHRVRRTRTTPLVQILERVVGVLRTPFFVTAI
jgi:hypothetical protein